MDQITASDPTKQLSLPTPSRDTAISHLPVQVYEASIRGGGCAPSLLCDDSTGEQGPDAKVPNRQVRQVDSQEREEDADDDDDDDEGQAEYKAWPGWAELENDPEIFTILLQEWGVPNVAVNEILDIADLITADPADILGLIFLSRYAPPDQSQPASPPPAQKEPPSKPWFANQISKFSCGTVALVNILMNTHDIRLSETLATFKHDTSHLNSKHKGIALDNHFHFRDIHNSFSTTLDRMIVDVLLKEDAQKWKHRKAAQARLVAQGDGELAKKRKRGGRAPFTHRRKKTAAVEDDDENGFHFVAYLQAHNSVWKLDGMQPHPRLVGGIASDLTWLNIAADDLLQKMQEALESGQECSLMSVTKLNPSPSQDQAQKLDKERKQDDWAPFIECMLRLHAEKGDLQEMLRL